MKNTQDKVFDFSVELFKKVKKDNENCLISPFSALSVLEMIYSGTDGDTKAQLAPYIDENTAELPQRMKWCGNIYDGREGRFDLASGMAVCCDITVKENYADKYNTAIFQGAFNDELCTRINKWVSKKTDGSVTKAMNSLPQNTPIALFNALNFQGEWMLKNDVIEGKFTFTDAKGEKRRVEGIFSEEREFISDDDAVGFIKPYYGDEYAFAAILPKNITLQEYIGNLSGAKLKKLLKSKKHHVEVSIPKIKADAELNLKDYLVEMGITHMFDREKSDFSQMLDLQTESEAYVSDLAQKINFELDEKGSCAKALTVGHMVFTSCAYEIHEVHLNRPFMYAIIEKTSGLPVLMGAVEDFEALRVVDDTL